MYRFSRSIYRELSPLVAVAPEEARCARAHLLEACEDTMRRLAADRRYFARPARTLFTEVREHFALNQQVRVYMVIEANIALAIDFITKLPGGVTLDGGPRECQASTRRGTPCQREPLPSREYCPSHKHLEETVNEPPAFTASPAVHA